MSEQPSHKTSTSEDEVSESGATSEGFGNLSLEDDAEGTVNPADLAAPEGPTTTPSTVIGRPSVRGVEQPAGTR
jgi:hypothetical protein